MKTKPAHLSLTLNSSLTDSTGGTPSATLASIAAGATYAQADLTALKNIVSQFAADLNLIRAALSAIQTQLNKVEDAA